MLQGWFGWGAEHAHMEYVRLYPCSIVLPEKSRIGTLIAYLTYHLVVSAALLNHPRPPQPIFFLISSILLLLLLNPPPLSTVKAISKEEQGKYTWT